MVSPCFALPAAIPNPGWITTELEEDCLLPDVWVVSRVVKERDSTGFTDPWADFWISSAPSDAVLNG